MALTYNHSQNIWDKLKFSIFQEIFASTDKIFFSEGGLSTR